MRRSDEDHLNNSPAFLLRGMAEDDKKRELERELERYRDLLRSYPEDSPTAETIRDYIADLGQRLRDLGNQ